MSKRTIILTLTALLAAVSCFQDPLPYTESIPEGTPITLTVEFGATDPVEVRVGTKAEATRADEERVHDLYVLLFDGQTDAAVKAYGHAFDYNFRWSNKSDLINNPNEGWFVENKALDGIDGVDRTRGAVKISTRAMGSCTLVLLANVYNTLISLDDEDPIDRLGAVTTLGELKDLTVRLNQDIVVRNDLFLMVGVKELSTTANMQWNVDDTQEYNADYKVTLKPVDAKVKFRITANPTTVKSITPHSWSVRNVPSSCYLFERPEGSYSFPAGESDHYFDSETNYFETEETENGVTYQVFTFYMPESCLRPAQAQEISDPSGYYLRELQDKISGAPNTPAPYVRNGGWIHAPERAPYVTFGASLVLTDTPGVGGIDMLNDWEAGETPVGVTAETLYTVHLGEFTQNGPNDYNTRRGHYYTYNITLNNATSIYAEVESFDPEDPGEGLEPQPGQEGSLLINSGGVVNCDAHYEYRSITFTYNNSLAYQMSIDPDFHVFSWFVRTPFTPDGAGPEWDSAAKRYRAPSPRDDEVDFLWVKFAVNAVEDGAYTEKRQPYPNPDKAAGGYNPDWNPGVVGPNDVDVNNDGVVTVDDVPHLMDINQLINYIYYQYRLEVAEPGSSIFIDGIIRATAFVDEYYYEADPFTGTVDPDLWRRFANADAREMHILSDVRPSRDRQSNLIHSSHSIIQHSIQTVYNVDSPELRSIWGTEHKDEMREKQGWEGWVWGVTDVSVNNDVKSEDNGRKNSAALWGLYPDNRTTRWDSFLKYDVNNDIPELKDEYRKMAYSCLARNRDNNGNGTIDPEEIRWYMASINQLKGMWVGNESLSTTARVYQPWGGDWRAHVISSTCPSSATQPKVLNAEEGVATFSYSLSGQKWAEGGAQGERMRETVRCVRNIGTYSNGNVVRDFTYAGYDQIPDQYFTVEEHEDPDHPGNANYSSYTIRFQRLNPLSVREFTDHELPFHNEKSNNNRVYLELHVQSRASRSETPDYDDTNLGPLRLDSGEINENITATGQNVYCPAGYRLPSQAELAMMTLTLPASYWNNAFRVPSRTYFSKGLYAAPGQQIASESEKLAWVYTNDILLPSRVDGANHQYSSRIRCVRDNERTGLIIGKMYLTESRVIPGQESELVFNFSSVGSALRNADLVLCYTNHAGNSVEKSIELDAPVSGLNYRTSQPFTMPSLASLGLTAEDLPVAMQFRIDLTNTASSTPVSFYAPFTLVGIPVNGELQLPPGRETEGFPVFVSASTISGATISGLELYFKRAGDANFTLLYDLSAEAAGATAFEKTVYFNPQPLQPGMYVFKLVSHSGAYTHTSPLKGMEIIKVNYTPNPQVPIIDGTPHDWTDSWWTENNYANAKLWHQSLVGNVDAQYVNKEQQSFICNQWRGQRVTNLHFDEGDYIEADIDLTRDKFIQTVDGNLSTRPPKDQVIGLDNIFSFGCTRVDWIGSDAPTQELHFYYPAHSGTDDDQLQVDPVYPTGKSYAQKKLGQLDDHALVLRLDQNGVFTNGSPVEWNESRYTNVLSRLLSSNSLVIGAMEGAHYSRATYNYVRVVHNQMGNISSGNEGGFGGDPINGGNL